MKKIIITLCIAAFINCAFAQSTYTGPRNTQELNDKLNNPAFPILNDLSQEVKNSLVQYVFFKEDKMKGMNGTDDNIQNLYNSNFTEVISSILNLKVVVYKKNDDGSGKPEIAGPVEGSYCSNCVMPEGGDIYTACCEVGGFGCIDFAIIKSSENTESHK